MNKVVLRQLSRNSWNGHTRYRNCYVYLTPYFTRTGGIYTGLSSEEAKRLGQVLGQDLSPLSEFWHKYFVRIGNKDLYIDPASPRGELDYLFLKSHKRVASSLDKISSSHDFVLIDENEEARTVNVYNRIKRQALKELDKLSVADRRRALRVYGFNPDTSSDEVVENRLSELVEKDPQKFFDIWVNNKVRDTEFLIKEAISQRVIERNRSLYKYGQDVIGHSLEEAIAFIDDPVNQEIKIAILKQLNKQ